MADVAADKPDAATSGVPSAGSAEIARLKRELEQAHAGIAELELRADVDPLIDIFNRRGFERELTRSLSYIERYGTDAALIYVDLDGFKAVNDAHGHAAGDALLKAVAGELTAHVRAPMWWPASVAMNSAC
jgi:GGDEF domain-containing protein